MANLTGPARFDPDVPPPARVYAYWIGSKDHYPADRKVAEEVAACRPQVVAGVDGDLREPDKILAEAGRTLDFARPAAVILAAVLHFIPIPATRPVSSPR